jgi:hypothetical protein
MRLVMWVLAVTVLLGACSDGSDPGAVVEGTEIVRTTTTTIPPAPHLESTSTIPVQLLPPAQVDRNAKSATTPDNLSWEGQQFDIGVIKKVGAASGGWVVAFDREEVVGAHGATSGKELTANPLGANAGPPTLRNASHAVTFFNVSANAPVNEITPNCAGDNLPSAVGETVPDLATYGVGNNLIDVLTFDSTGLITLIQLTHPC